MSAHLRTPCTCCRSPSNKILLSRPYFLQSSVSSEKYFFWFECNTPTIDTEKFSSRPFSNALASINVCSPLIGLMLDTVTMRGKFFEHIELSTLAAWYE